MYCKKVINTVMLGVMIAMLSACAALESGLESVGLFDEAAPKPVMSVAVLPFENLTPQRTAGIVISKLFYTELFGQERINLVEENAVRNFLKTNNVNTDRLSDNSSVQELGAQMKADRLVLGSVSRYGNGDDLFSEPAVAISVQLVDVHSGKVLWAESRTDVVSSFFWSNERSIEGLAQELVEDLVEDLIDEQ
jgi:TolB-like protein